MMASHVGAVWDGLRRDPIAVQPKASGAPKTGDMMMGRPVAKFYEAVTTQEQTVF